MADRVGQQLGNYRLQRLLGRGGFADVYLGEHTYLHKPAALKLLHLCLDEQDTEQFLHEAQTLARLDHPHIVRVLDFAVQDGLPYLVMDYAIGGTLRTRHPTGTRLPLEQILTYVSQVASALQYAHDQRLIHRDIKPENMLLDAREQVLLADFGLALLTPTRSASTQAMDPAMAGTAPYMAPEQVQGQPRAASDQYALAVVVYEWLSGQRPFTGTPIEIAMQHVSAVPPPLHEQLPDLSPEVEQVVMRALAKAPEQRFPSVQDFATALHHAAQPASDAYLTSAVPTTSEATPGERTATEPFWKVPTSLTPLVGREQDVAAVCAMLARPDVRLLTLVGVGGIGKTRLGIQVANQLRARFADGVCFVGLAPISDPSLVISSIAHELGLQEAGVQPLVETVKAWLQNKHFLLLLDNFEQIISSAPLLEDLLAACPQLVILVTSREVLRLSAEHLFPVPTLSLPDLAQLPDHEQLSQYAAVSLFLLRAQALKPDFQLTTANAHVVAEICVRLDGLPLAIELAAARIRLLPPQALLARLSQRLQVLTGGSQTLPARQQTLRNTIQWSYDLLTEPEQRLFRWLSIFVGGCTLEAAEVVCQQESTQTFRVLDGIASLLDKSLLQHTVHEGEEPRLLMLETIREFGLEQLHQQGEAEAAHRAHARYYLQLSEAAELHLFGPEQLLWLDRLERDLDNLRAILQAGTPGSEEEMELDLRLAGALRLFWAGRGYLREGCSILERYLAGARAIAAPIRLKALNAVGMILWVQSNARRLEQVADEILALAREQGDHLNMTVALILRGTAMMLDRRDYAAIQAYLEEALTQARALGDRLTLVWALTSLGRLALYQRDASRAIAWLEEGLALCRAMSDKVMINVVLVLFVRAELSQGHAARAQTLLEEGLTISRVAGNTWATALMLSLLGQVAFQQGKMDQAEAFLTDGTRLASEVGDQRNVARSRLLLAGLAALRGDYAAARLQYEEGLSTALNLKYTSLIASGLKGLGCVAAAQGVYAWAALLWGAAQALRESRSVAIPQEMYERLVAVVRSQLGEPAFTQAEAQGRTMTAEQALAWQQTIPAQEAPISTHSSPTPPHARFPSRRD